MPVAALRDGRAPTASDQATTRATEHVIKLKEWIAGALGAARPDDPAARQHARNLAVAALLVEVLRADYDVSAPERRQVVDSIRELLELEPAECEALLLSAERQVYGAHDLHQFTSELNRSLSHDDKLDLLEQLWRVAQSDSTVHHYEEHLIRRVADLLHVSHREFIVTKLRSSGGD
jgi:uncharacterized tellurite resistance protein B-like protein